MAKMKIGLEADVAQYKSAMRAAQASTKTLSAELKLNEAQYKKTGDKEEYLRQRTELLNKQIEEQNKVVDNADKALETMAQSEQASAEELERLKQSVIKAKTELVTMQAELTQGAESLDKTGDAADDAADQLARLDKNVNFNTLMSKLKLVKDLAVGVANGITSALKGVWNFMGDEGTVADDMITAAQNMRVSVETYQRMAAASKFGEMSVDDMAKAQDKLLKLYNNGIYTIGDYGIRAEDTHDAMWRTLEIISKITDATEQEAMAQELFGKSWREASTLWENRGAYWDEFNRVDVVSEDLVYAAGEMNDAKDKLLTTWDSFKLELAANFAEPMTEVYEALEELLGKIREFFDSPEGKQFINGVVSSIKKFVEYFDPEEFFESIKDIVSTILSIARFLGISTTKEKSADKVMEDQTSRGASPNETRALMLASGQFTEEEINAAYNNKVNALLPDVEESGADIVDAAANGILSQIDEAGAAGAALGAQVINGAASAAGGTSYTNNTTFGDVYINNGTDAEALANQIATEQARMNAGYGG